MKKLKVALLGYGGMGHFHATQYDAQKNCELAAVCDINPEAFRRDEMELNIGSSGKSEKSNFFINTHPERK